MSVAIVLDTETTDTSEEAQVIELAFSDAIGAPAAAAIAAAEISCFRFSATRTISLGAMAVHNIIEDDLIGFPIFNSSLLNPLGADFIIGHNVDFDWRVSGRPVVKRICTLALCRYLWPKLETHKLAAMVYSLVADQGVARHMIKNSHSAKGDVLMLLQVLLPCILHERPCTTWDELYALSEVARIPTIMPFGKYKGTALVNVPGDYKRWLLNQPDIDPYLKVALRTA